MKSLTCALALTAAMALPALAAEDSDYLLETAGDLADLCDEPENAAAIHMCHGYLMGVHHMHQGIVDSMNIRIYCIPPDTPKTRNDVVNDFVAWVAATPGAAEMPARRGLLGFAQQEFPCE